ncbi:hypothetical protein N643_14875 [Salmonella bongori serovar 48:z41:-- str. RKS3044]|uniref:Uncharacterized protein n=1 Tax=Salmonella bongori serovar 44:r:- TaxID=1967585 RepID=A0A702FH68_SALBN|nr:hypothetical protein N643_14875 [Salmonella bongori serovar 48:z41:-- str. RKS3044]HAC6693234.1 hypothetical protein [Salmonella bongori serovar 44:r:-]
MPRYNPTNRISYNNTVNFILFYIQLVIRLATLLSFYNPQNFLLLYLSQLIKNNNYCANANMSFRQRRTTPGDLKKSWNIKDYKRASDNQSTMLIRL